MNSNLNLNSNTNFNTQGKVGSPFDLGVFNSSATGLYNKLNTDSYNNLFGSGSNGLSGMSWYNQAKNDPSSSLGSLWNSTKDKTMNGDSSWFDNFFKDFKLGDAFSGLGAVGSLLGAINAFRQSALAEDVIDYQKNLANRNIANMTKQINNQYDSNAKNAAAFTGGTDDGLTTEDLRKKYLSNAKEKYLDGSPI